METYHIHFNGVVQGVGFRPVVYQLATKMRLNGYVKNGNDGVNIFFNASSRDAYLFLERIKSSLPPKAIVISSELRKVPTAFFDTFTVEVDEDLTERKVLIAPDIALCDRCRTEMNDEHNRRYRYPFITCTQCGPRYSIVNELPYERHTTAMRTFSMCTTCDQEYRDITDRRFLSQTNSCNECGIKLQLFTRDCGVLADDTERVLFHVKNFLMQGKILAVKGIGGYLLLCDANNSKAIRLLRNRKHRPSKPLAVLYPDIQSVQYNFLVNSCEKALLQSPEAPIVLLYPKKQAANTIAIDDIAPGLRRVGAMLPYNPLLELIIHDFMGPLIATSANISGSPIIYRDEDALEYLFDIADYIVIHNREIAIPQDDSVVQVSKYTGQQIILRRSRGYAPSYLHYQSNTNRCVLATGAYLKSSFTLSINGNTFVSQFLGSGESYESQLMYKHTLTHFLNLYGTKPNVIMTDLHPGYFSHQYAIELGKTHLADVKFVQHHEMHFTAVLAENDLLHSIDPVLGVVWDGTGLGEDGRIWGGEFFKYRSNKIQRCCHFDYFPAIAGDKLALEPRIVALCIAYHLGSKADFLKEKFADTEWNNYLTLIANAMLFSSSVGRLFDAVASILGICDKQTYEGEAAMYLQALADEYVNIHGLVMDRCYGNIDRINGNIPTSGIIEGILTDLEKGRAIDYIAAKFHYSLVLIVDVVAKRQGITSIAFSGGVFQNGLLVDWIKHLYSDKYQLYFHKHLSPNDENISFGQMVYHDQKIATIPEGLKTNTPETLYEQIQ